MAPHATVGVGGGCSVGTFLTRARLVSAAAAAQLDTQVQVWERTCAACNGSGFSRSRWGGRTKAKTSVCLLCSGLGAVRCASTRLEPDLRDGTGDVSGLGRKD